MLDCLLDGLLDTLKILPYLFVTFLVLELIEHKLNKKAQKTLAKYQKIGPVIGGITGGFPQCGFSAMAANLYTGRVITIGTLVAIFLSTSDEMLPIMIGEQASFGLVAGIVGFKIIIGIIVGLIVDLIFKNQNHKNEIKEICHDEHCNCDKDGAFIASLKHTFKTTLFVLIANLLINIIIYVVGEEKITDLLTSKNVLTYFVASLIGLVPNCAASIVLTEAFLTGFTTIGVTMAGLLTGSGLGILLLFKNNKSLKENLTVLSIIYFVGVIVGILIDLAM